jgi:hypothetical protein
MTGVGYLRGSIKSDIVLNSTFASLRNNPIGITSFPSESDWLFIVPNPDSNGIKQLQR